MKISLIGPSYPAYSSAVSAQQSLNVYLETIEVAEGKNKYVLRGRPGMTLFKNLTAIDAAATPVRGIWSCAGPSAGTARCFVAAGTKFFEIDIAGNLVGSVSTIANDSLPVDILPNGNQLEVVSGGLSYCDNGAGLVANTLPTLSGTAGSDGTGTLVWSPFANSGTGNFDQFDIGMLGQTINYHGSPFTVTSITNPTLITVTPAPAARVNGDWDSVPVMNAGRLAFVDGFFIINRPNSRQFNQSGLMDGSTWGGLDFDIKEGYPDNILAPWSEPPVLYMLGAETMELYQNTGKTSGTVFERVSGGFSRVGLAATWSPVSIMGKLHMLAGGNYGQTVAVRMEGATPVRISTHAVEEAWKGAAFPAQGFSFSYVDRGHWFWVITFDTGNAWVYDATESALQGSPQWHERAQWDGAAFQPYTPRFHTFIPQWNNGTHIVGDYASGKLYIMSSDTIDDNGSNIRYVRALPYIYNNGKLMYFRRFEVVLETGTATTPPTVLLDWSDDNGQTFGTGAGVGTSRALGPGVHNTFTTRYYTFGLGSSHGRIFRLTITGKGKIAVIDAQAEYTLGTA